MTVACQRVRNFTKRPPDHWMGWFVAVSGALMQMMSYGIDNSFSTFSSSMQSDPTLGFPSSTAVSFGNSVSLGLSPVFGVFAGFLVDRVPPRIMMFISTALLFLGCWLASSFAKSSVEVAFSYCLLASISSAFMLSPGAAATGSWFHRGLGLAQGLTFSGGGIGSAWISPILGTWVEAYGWRKTFRLMSSFCAIGLLACIFSCRRGEPDPTSDMDEEEEHEGDVPSSNGKLVTPKEGSLGDDRLLPDHDDADDDDVLPDTCGRRRSAGAEDAGNAAAAAPGNTTTATTNEEIAGVYKGFFTPEKELMAILRVRRLRPAEYARALLTRAFLSNLFMFAIYGWAFYGLIYITVPYVSSMGKAGTAYANVTPISTSKASSVYTFWGVFQIVGSILVGGLASFTADEFAYCACCVVGAISTALLTVCRDYAAFAATYSIVGFCSAGVFAVMPALIARSFYGPNLGFFMGAVFVAGCLGGFSAPPIQAQIAAHYNGNYTYGCVFISVSFTMPGILCYALLWPNKQNFITRWWRRRAEQIQASLHPQKKYKDHEHEQQQEEVEGNRVEPFAEQR